MTRSAWSATLALLIFTMGTSIVTPLLPLYQTRFGLTDGQITLLFATYTLTVVPTMLVMGGVSDRIGRKKVMGPAMVSVTLASLVLAFASNVPMLFAGRVLQGLAIGSFLGVGTALIVDHAQPMEKAWAAMVAGLAFRLGFGLGPGLAGVIAQNASEPIRRPFEFHVLLMVVAFMAFLVTPETIRRLPRNASSGGRWRIQVGVPAGQMAGFATFLAPGAFVLGFLDATLLSVVPLYMVAVLGVRNLALIGLVGFLELGLGGVTPLIARQVPARIAVMVGVGGGALASLLVVSASQLHSVGVVLIAAAAIGLLNGLTLQGATAICGVSVPIAERGKLLSALYMCAYAGTIPTIGLGYLAQAVGITAALGAFSACAIALAAVVILVGGRVYREVIPYLETPVDGFTGDGA
jgi:predicted MFS family arabinose efflux permease